MLTAIRILSLLIILGAGLCVAAIIMAISAAIGLVVNLALIGAPVLLTIVLAVKDLYVRHKLKQWLKQNPPTR